VLRVSGVRTVVVSWQPEQDRFEARGTHPVTIPINAPHGDGPATGFSATELLLAGAGSCSTWDVVEIMRKARQDLRGLDVEVVGEQAVTEPWQYDRLRLRYTFRGHGISRERAERAVALSVEKYCSVLATLRGVAKIETEVVVIDEPAGEPTTTASTAEGPAIDDDLPPGLPDLD
jgi:putative redox protein